jgi:alginate O-acetyltransferase complex protein AlgI
MLFNSYTFIFIFLPITLLVFFSIGGKGHHRIAIAWLVAASLFFYGWWNPAYLSLILGSILFNYAVGVALSNLQAQSSASHLTKKIILSFGILVNLFLLAYFKYANFFVDNLNSLSGSNFHLQTIILPLAISFFTFQQITYLVDAYKGETREYNFLHYCLFVTFFPQLIAGPIVHHREMLPQFVKNTIYKFNHQHLAIGLTIFFIGLFKKVVLADGVAVYATPVFEAAEQGVMLTFFEAWAGALAYTFQLYFDFSGYSDMAIGIARMFGIRLPLNFNSPYKSVNIIEFWRRWHITLSRFLRDYLYIPLGGNRKGKFRRYINLMITMLLGGLWHGWLDICYVGSFAWFLFNN